MINYKTYDCKITKEKKNTGGNSSLMSGINKYNDNVTTSAFRISKLYFFL